MKALLADLFSCYDQELRSLPSHEDFWQRGFGPGYPLSDAAVLYMMLRRHRPRRYLEVGSGLSTCYATLAAARQAAEGRPLAVTCVEPYPYAPLRSLPGIELIVSEVQDVPLERFQCLEAGDVLFIDSSHVLKIDSDVAYLFLEVLPRLAPGVIVHVHDINFPYNVPLPVERWVIGSGWPRYWNEAMLLQAFLCGNSQYRILLSASLLAHRDQSAVQAVVPSWLHDSWASGPPAAIWLQRA